MRGKRIQKKPTSGLKLLGATAVLLAAGTLLLASGPQGAAVNSPLEQDAPASLTEELPSAPAEE